MALAALVRDAIGADPFSGSVYVFRSKRADRIKLVFWMGPAWFWWPSGSRAAPSTGRASRQHRAPDRRPALGPARGSGLATRSRPAPRRNPRLRGLNGGVRRTPQGHRK